MFEIEKKADLGANIKVIGIGGGGGNAIYTMILESLKGVEFIVANTDIQALKANPAEKKIQLGVELTRGLGAGANPEIGQRAALESYEEIAKSIESSDMVFITAGMGGGTGTGGAPIVAQIAREMGILCIGVVTKPFVFEGKKRTRYAEEGIRHFKDNVDTLIVIPNQKLISVAGEKTSLVDTFKKADEVLLHAVKGISDLISVRGLINLDFADIKTVMSAQGMAIMGVGKAQGENRAVEAATKAISSPLLENIAIEGATGIIINVTGGEELTLWEVNEASSLITEAADENAEIIFGAVIDQKMKDEIFVTVIATGFGMDKRASMNSVSENLKALEKHDEVLKTEEDKEVEKKFYSQVVDGEKEDLQISLEGGIKKGPNAFSKESEDIAKRIMGKPALKEILLAKTKDSTYEGKQTDQEENLEMPTYLRKRRLEEDSSP